MHIIHFISLVLYVYYGALYMDSMKRNPKIDFMISALLAMFWLAGAAAWANGLTGLKWASDTYVLMHPRHIHRLSAMTAPSQPPFNISHSAPEQLWLFCW